MLLSRETLVETGIDGAALKPAKTDVAAGLDLPFDLVTVDYEGRDHLPDADELRRLAEAVEVRVTVPVRADGFDPLGDDHLFAALPDGVAAVLVAGHPAYLSEAERSRAIAPRLGAALDRAPDAWVGTEGIERVALATGATQYHILSPGIAREIRAIRAAGFEGEVAVYAPTAFVDDADATLDAVGDYVARRGPVRRALPDDPTTDRRASGRVRETLLDAAPDYALVGTPEAVSERVAALKEAGADYVVGHPARGPGEFRGE